MFLENLPAFESCPFCVAVEAEKSPVLRSLDAGVGCWFVECRACAARGPMNDDPQEAVILWNKPTVYEEFLRGRVELRDEEISCLKADLLALEVDLEAATN